MLGLCVCTSYGKVTWALKADIHLMCVVIYALTTLCTSLMMNRSARLYSSQLATHVYSWQDLSQKFPSD